MLFRSGTISSYTDGFENLFLIGRNGMHRYNNQDHSMLTAMMAVDNILEGRTDKSNLWEVNTEVDYHEEKGNANGSPDDESQRRTSFENRTISPRES